MPGIFSKPSGWIFMVLPTLMVSLVATFAILKPVQVMPRIAAGPSYALVNSQGAAVSEQTFAGQITLYGFGYSYDLTGALDQTLSDMQAFQALMRDEDLSTDTSLALILFDPERDTLQRLEQFAGERQLDLSSWMLLTGDAGMLKRTIGQGFGVYYEAVPLADLPGVQPEVLTDPQGYGYLQAQRYLLIDDVNIIRAEYRAPLDVERTLRDVRLIVRERVSTGASRTLNEAAHLFLCYPD